MLHRVHYWLVALSMAALPALLQAQSLEGVLSPGELVAGHKKWDDDCRACHVPFERAAQSQLCADCHKPIGADLRSHKRFHGRLKDSTCRRCHTEHQGRNAKITVLDKENFDHGQTAFPLKGGHKKPETKCENCHKPGVKYRDTPQRCEACHRKDDNEKGHKGKLGPKCEDCHNDVKWKETSKFDHNKTRFKLEQGHKDVKCKECHADQLYQFKDNPRACVACHKKDDDDPKKKGHKGRYGDKCEKCHDAAKWKEPLFDHGKDAKYELKGKHFDAKCDTCHKEPLYTVKLPTACYACHKKDDDQKGHKGSLGEKCEKCHNEKNWKTSKFDHDLDTDYPLTGKHWDTKCEKCHKAGVTAVEGKPREKLPKACVACHRKDDDDPAKKGHKGRFGERCNSCHTTKEWKDLVFNHDWDTNYRLVGKHREARCETCHNKPGEIVAAGVAREKLATACVACHKKDDDDPKKKGHKGNYGEKCQTCHTEKGWKDSIFNHDRDTKYRLLGKHEKATCVSCHQPERHLYKEKTSTDCNSCHRKDDFAKGHKGTLNVRCEICHSTSNWRVEKFDHNKSRFPLTGGHAFTDCKKCHQSIAYRTTPRTCNGCHEKEDVHKRRLGIDCESCHNTRTWKSWDFDHDKTGFRLDGGHVKPDCYACHKAPMQKRRNQAVVTGCAICHGKDDVHRGAFGPLCGRCHGTSAWLPALRL